MTNVEQALVEIRQQRSVFTPQLEGLYDYRRLNILDDTRASVEILIADYERRMAHINAAEEQLIALMSDGHPGFNPPREVSPEALADLQENKNTIDAALALFASNMAQGLGLVSGEKASK